MAVERPLAARPRVRGTLPRPGGRRGGGAVSREINSQEAGLAAVRRAPAAIATTTHADTGRQHGSDCHDDRHYSPYTGTAHAEPLVSHKRQSSRIRRRSRRRNSRACRGWTPLGGACSGRRWSSSCPTSAPEPVRGRPAPYRAASCGRGASAPGRQARAARMRGPPAAPPIRQTTLRATSTLLRVAFE